MKSDDCYITASRYDIKSQSRNRRVFHRELVTHPWRAFVFAIGMCALAATASFNLVDAPQWNRHPWMGWLLGGIAFFFVCYFLWCAVQGWRVTPSNQAEPKP
jgi:amino acid permease